MKQTVLFIFIITIGLFTGVKVAQAYPYPGEIKYKNGVVIEVGFNDITYKGYHVLPKVVFSFIDDENNNTCYIFKDTIDCVKNN